MDHRKLTHLTNANLFQTDFSAEDRRKALRQIARGKVPKVAYLAPGLKATGLIGVDVSAMDRRSVKAQLAARGDFRVVWWNLNVFLHRLMRPTATMEQIMVAFHKRHHFVTLGWLSLAADYREVFKAIRCKGALAGLHCAIDQARRNADGHPQESDPPENGED